MRHTVFTAYLIMGITALWASDSWARAQVRVVGSATVYPFITAAAEQFGQGSDFKTPIVEATGTGGGFKLFCEGQGIATPDMNNASRRITSSEVELCKKNNAGDIIEVPIGYDGIVLANIKGATLFNLTYKQIFMALARELPDEKGALVKNNTVTWRDIDKTLPDYEIKVYGPPPTSGTRDTFVELAMEKGCMEIAAFAVHYPDEKKRKKICHMLREDGKFVESGENYNIVVQKLSADEHALGIMGFGFYDENASKIQASHINGVDPTAEAIASGNYALSRTLYVYVKKAHMPLVAGLTEFVDEIASEGANGADGYMSVKGLVPLNAKDKKEAQAAIAKMRP